jgi:OOP family OmpA-OmpF porin
MKQRTIILALLAAFSAISSAYASEFDGSFVGARIAADRSNIKGSGLNVVPTNPYGGKDGATLGIDAGYNWTINSYVDYVVGVEAFLDDNTGVDNRSSNVYGADLKLGVSRGDWMPYARLGYANTNSSGTTPYTPNGGGLHGGLGIELKFTPNWGVNAEWLSSTAKTNGSTFTNDTLGLGLHYYFNAVKPVPFPVVEKKAPMPAPVVVHEPVPAPVVVEAKAVPVPPPVVQPAPQPKKVVVTEKLINLDGANFATNSAKLLKGADVRLNEVVNAAKQYPDTNFEVSGHTDSRGNKASNQKLSENRAASVKDWLVKHGVAAGRISTIGYADSKPIADNKTPSGRAENRRVEVRYTAKQ